MTALALRLRALAPASLRIDRVLLAFLLILGLLAALDGPQAVASAGDVAASLLATAPWLLVAVLSAAAAAATGADHLVAGAFRGRVAAMVVFATLLGAFSPFCSCGVIPLIAALLSMGVPLAPVMAFWLASPVIDPAQFALTAGTLGADFAVAKLAAALFLGLLGGFGTMALGGAGYLAAPLRDGVGNGGCGGARVRNPRPPVWAFWREPERLRKFGREAGRSAVFLGKWLALAFLLESLMVRHVPEAWVAGLIGAQSPAPVLIATLVGVPAYLNGYAALPLVSGLVAQGMDEGAALAFLVAGAVSCIPAAMAVWALVRPPVFALYLGFAVAGSLVAGLVFGAVA